MSKRAEKIQAFQDYAKSRGGGFQARIWQPSGEHTPATVAFMELAGEVLIESHDVATGTRVEVVMTPDQARDFLFRLHGFIKKADKERESWRTGNV